MSTLGNGRDSIIAVHLRIARRSRKLRFGGTGNHFITVHPTIRIILSIAVQILNRRSLDLPFGAKSVLYGIPSHGVL